MSSLITQLAPEFTAQAIMPDKSFGKVSLKDYRGKYVVLFFYPLDFSFVCPTELHGFSDAIADFESRNVQVLACSTDSQYSHLAWVNSSRDKGGLGQLTYPLISDFDKEISRAYGILLPGGMALRGLFLIDKDGIVRHETVNDLPFGRNVDEELRMVDALQFYEQHGEVCPVNWKRGDGGIKTT